MSYMEIDKEVIWRVTDEIPKWKSKSKGISDGQRVLESDS